VTISYEARSSREITEWTPHATDKGFGLLICPLIADSCFSTRPAPHEHRAGKRLEACRTPTALVKQWHSPYRRNGTVAALGSIGLRRMLKEHHFRIVAWQDFSDCEAAKIERTVRKRCCGCCTGRWPSVEVMQHE
jgi:hypothetical protein